MIGGKASEVDFSIDLYKSRSAIRKKNLFVVKIYIWIKSPNVSILNFSLDCNKYEKVK